MLNLTAYHRATTLIFSSWLPSVYEFPSPKELICSSCCWVGNRVSLDCQLWLVKYHRLSATISSFIVHVCDELSPSAVGEPARCAAIGCLHADLCRCAYGSDFCNCAEQLLLVLLQLADQLVALRSGAMTSAQFAAATTPDALAAALAKTQLPGRVAAPGALPAYLPNGAQFTFAQSYLFDHLDMYTSLWESAASDCKQTEANRARGFSPETVLNASVPT